MIPLSRAVAFLALAAPAFAMEKQAPAPAKGVPSLSLNYAMARVMVDQLASLQPYLGNAEAMATKLASQASLPGVDKAQADRDMAAAILIERALTDQVSYVSVRDAIGLHAKDAMAREIVDRLEALRHSVVRDPTAKEALVRIMGPVEGNWNISHGTYLSIKDALDQHFDGAYSKLFAPEGKTGSVLAQSQGGIGKIHLSLTKPQTKADMARLIIEEAEAKEEHQRLVEKQRRGQEDERQRSREKQELQNEIAEHIDLVLARLGVRSSDVRGRELVRDIPHSSKEQGHSYKYDQIWAVWTPQKGYKISIHYNSSIVDRYIVDPRGDSVTEVALPDR